MNAHASTARAERTTPLHVGEHLREWRQRRHLSQLDLAGDAEISARHLSFVETGRAAPSREMVLKLAERLNVPLRERNVLLIAAGFAPAFPQRPLDDPALKSARQAIDLVLKAHEPNPALAYDRHWNLVSANRMVAPLLAGVPPRMLTQLSIYCGWRFIRRGWRRAPSISPNGPGISWSGCIGNARPPPTRSCSSCIRT
jgi:transcriptional regulator with XRE-family HTH domain